MTIFDFTYVSVSVFTQPLERTASCVANTLENSKLLGRFSVVRAPLDLTRVLAGQPLHGAGHSRRIVLFSSDDASKATVFVSNRWDGWMTLVNCVSRDSHCEAYMFTVSGPTEEFPMNDFSLWYGGSSMRSVHALRDSDKWVFYEKGERLGAEDPSAYAKRRVKDRLNREGVIRIAKNLGYLLDEPKFWTSTTDAVYFLERACPGEPVNDEQP